MKRRNTVVMILINLGLGNATQALAQEIGTLRNPEETISQVRDLVLEIADNSAQTMHQTFLTSIQQTITLGATKPSQEAVFNVNVKITQALDTPNSSKTRTRICKGSVQVLKVTQLPEQGIYEVLDQYEGSTLLGFPDIRCK